MLTVVRSHRPKAHCEPGKTPYITGETDPTVPLHGEMFILLRFRHWSLETRPRHIAVNSEESPEETGTGLRHFAQGCLQAD